MKVCKVCGRPSEYMYCEECERQVRDFFTDAIASAMDWMDIDYETAAGLGEYVMSCADSDWTMQENAEIELRRLRRTTNGEVTKNSK